MKRKYFIGGKEVTKSEWEKAYQKHPAASVILRVPSLPRPYNPPGSERIITAERAKEIRELKNNQYKNPHEKSMQMYDEESSPSRAY